MPRFFRRHNFTEDDKAKAGEVNDVFADAATCINNVYTQQLVDDSILDVAIDYTEANDGLLVWGAGPAYGGSAGRHIAVSVETVDFSTNTAGSFTVTFATDCIDGDPSFSSGPLLMSYGINSEETAEIGYAGLRFWMLSSSSTTATVHWIREDATDVTARKVHFVWFGLI